jgi:putative phosphoribosyl transferase
MQTLYRDREEAGKKLAEALRFLKGRKDVLVLAIPRGGVPVAKEVADALRAPLDLIVTRKIGAPGNPELAVGAVTQDGESVIDTGLVRTLGIPDDYLRREALRQVEEIGSRMRRYRGGRPYPVLEGKTLVIVDDGVATGSTVKAAIESARRRRPAEVIVAVPVGSREAIGELSGLADRVVCLSTPEPFFAIGEFYRDFDQVGDETVRDILRGSGRKMA